MSIKRIALVLVALVGQIVACAPSAPAIEIAPFTSVYSRNINGQFALTGNSVQTCSDALGVNASHCIEARNFGSTAKINNDDFVMRNLVQPMGNIPSSQLINASSAQIQFPRGAIVKKAFLFWFGNLETPSQAQFEIAPQDESAKNKVLFSRPNENCSGVKESACTISGSVYTESLGANQEGFYSAHADVTTKLLDSHNMEWTTIGDIQSAIFSVGNIQGAQGLGTSAGWSLVVVYTHPDENFRHINIDTGFGFIAPRSSQHIALSGLAIPLSGDAESSVGIIGTDGDAATLGDSLTIASGSSSRVVANSANPADNVMNSSVTENGVQSTYLDGEHVGRSKNTFGTDADRIGVMNLLPHGSTTARASFTSTSDTYYISALVTATPVDGAQLQVTKYVSNVTQGGTGNSPEVTEGDLLEYSMSIKNVGNRPAQSVALTDEFDSEHLSNVFTSTPGCSISNLHLTCANLGALSPTDSPKVVVVSAQVMAGIGTIKNYSTATFNGDSEIISNTVTVAYAKSSVDLGLALHFEPGFVQAGQAAVLRATITNFGITAESNPMLKLAIPTGLRASGGWPLGCTQREATLTCSGAAFGIDVSKKLRSGDSATLAIEVATSTGPSHYESIGEVRTSAVGADPNLDNNFATAVLGANHPPIARNAVIRAVQSGSIKQLDISPYVSDRDGDSLHFSFAPPNGQYGKVRLSATTFTFKPSTLWHGTFQFAYRVWDGRAGSDSAFITVIVLPKSSIKPTDNGTTIHHSCHGFIRAGC